MRLQRGPLTVSAFVAALLFSMSLAPNARAEEVSKNACVDAHSRGQDARDQGKLAVARKLFMTCAQASCPALVQNDCARFADDLERYQPWVSFTARDGEGHDLPDTTVYVDDVLVLTQLEDGKPLEIDPGKHVVRFVHGEREQVMTIVVSSGEKGRRIVGTFESETPREGGAGESQTKAEAPKTREQEKPKAALGSRLMIGASTAVIATGLTLGVFGLKSVPDNCSLSDRNCAAPPGDTAFTEASDAVKLSNIGWAVSGVGSAALAASIIWYVRSKRADEAERSVTPWATSTAAGLSFTGRL